MTCFIRLRTLDPIGAKRTCLAVPSVSIGRESQKLDRPLPIKGAATLHTIGQAVDYMTGIGRKRELLSHWQRVAKLVLAKEDVLTVSRALELALFMDAKLDVSQL
jgi:hypothetical protein